MRRTWEGLLVRRLPAILPDRSIVQLDVEMQGAVSFVDEGVVRRSVARFCARVAHHNAAVNHRADLLAQLPGLLAIDFVLGLARLVAYRSGKHATA